MQSIPPAKSGLAHLLCVTSHSLPLANSSNQRLAHSWLGLVQSMCIRLISCGGCQCDNTGGLELNETTINHNFRLIPEVEDLSAEEEKTILHTHLMLLSPCNHCYLQPYISCLLPETAASAFPTCSWQGAFHLLAFDRIMKC